MQKIIFATGNKAKLTQIKFIVQYFKFQIEIINGKDVFRNKMSYKEIGNTVDKVALNSALAFTKMINRPVITEDTDLRIEALNGKPGIRAGEFLKKFGRLEILKKMKNATNRNAVISSAIAFATPKRKTKIFVNRVKGKIAKTEKYGNFPDWIAPTLDDPFGGGYNAIFIPNGWNKTLAEISPKQVIPWSYRESNFIKMIRYILR